MDALTEEQKTEIATKRAEALKQAEDGYAKLDTNGDGVIDRDELKAMAKEAGQNLTGGQMEAKIDEFLNTFDANNDGVVSKQEWLDFFGNLFDAVISQGLSSWSNSLTPTWANANLMKQEETNFPIVFALDKNLHAILYSFPCWIVFLSAHIIPYKNHIHLHTP